MNASQHFYLKGPNFQEIWKKIVWKFSHLRKYAITFAQGCTLQNCCSSVTDFLNLDTAYIHFVHQNLRLGVSGRVVQACWEFTPFYNTYSAIVSAKWNAFVNVMLVTHAMLATARDSQCLFEYVTIGLARHNRTHVSQSERLLVKPNQRGHV